ncbi:Gfo/Idh/MocA family protein [Haloferula sp. A504]|uniref:Gfo/Idh/MocA family protein n=1 Tax=Haloferula sp. A504 TaxID=3373601 RepID=UPI0031C26692|nr:Gfo/Idh/MocA family oxidoreductase [Verrucomicrobiaceae bacterium E54]
MKRRHFIQRSAAFSVPLIVPASVLGKGGTTAPSERVGVGLIGCGGQGSGVFNGMLNLKEVQGLAVCDPDAQRMNKAKDNVEKRYAKEKESGSFKGCDTHADFRELCAREDIDAVVVGTPDHWHAVTALAALRAGKDVYCEKPVTHLFAEGQALYKEVAKREAIFQTGSQQRSDTRFRVGAEIVLNGLIGKIKHVEVGLPTGKGTDIEGKEAQPIPDHLDYDMWCGPSRLLPYNEKRLHWNWRWCLDYGGGQLMDWIGHHNDIAHWGLGLDKSGPVQVEAKGFRYADKGMYDQPLDYEVLSTYADGYTVSISNKNTMGCKWIGEDGWVYVNRGKIDASNKEWIRESFDRGPVKAYASRDHRRNFIEGVLTRKECICPAETAHRSITPGHIGYVSDALKRPLKWDPIKEEIVGDPEADKLLKKIDYRGEWKI